MKPRPAILPQTHIAAPRLHIVKRDHGTAGTIKLTLFIAVWAVIVLCLLPDTPFWRSLLGRFIIPAIAAFILGYATLVIWDSIALHRELKRMAQSTAFQHWLDRTATVGRQFNIIVSDRDPVARLHWLQFYKDGCTPQETIALIRNVGDSMDGQ
jgi:hypothetical protein